MVDKLRLKYLFKQLAKNTISDGEYIELCTYLNEEKSNVEFYAAMDEIWKDRKDDQVSEEHKKILYRKIIVDPRFQKTKLVDIPKRKVRNPNLRIQIVAASILFIISAVIYQYLTKDQSIDSQLSELSYNDILPGEEKAILTLADGSVISLNEITEGKIMNQFGVSVSKDIDGQIVYKMYNNGDDFDSLLFNTISTPKGGQYQVILADGTKVWLNAASSLVYPTKFNLTERRVELKGEAYFEVAKSNAPFLVLTKNQKVEVLGTHFNINSYEDEHSTRTTLLEGSVHVIPITPNLEHTPINSGFLKPGQQSILKSDGLRIVNADIETAMDWKNNDFVFKEENIKSIMRKISRWYDIEVEYVGENDKLRFGGLVSRKKNISTVLKVLEETGLVKFKIKGRRITVMI